jgi:hypothetical protein
MSEARNNAIAALDDAARLVRDYVVKASNDEVAGLEGILSELIRVRDRFETATNPLLLEERRLLVRLTGPLGEH